MVRSHRKNVLIILKDVSMHAKFASILSIVLMKNLLTAGKTKILDGGEAAP